jgi:pimeloyl-ACP methyl ester carboxylesterase
LKRVVLVGHSMGGPVILEAARLMPERVAALVPVDTLNRVGESTPAEQKKAFLDPMRADFKAVTQKFVRQVMFTPRSDPALVEWIVNDMASAPAAVGVSALENLLDYDDAKALAAIKAPVRLINADRFPTDLAGARKAKPDVQLAVMPGVGHFLMLEDPDEFNRLLERAIKELAAP